MTTTTKTKNPAPATETDELRNVPGGPPRRMFAWKPFAAFPRDETKKVIGLSDSAKRLWLVLVLASRSFSARVEFTNEKLQTEAGVSGTQFRIARKELEAAGVLTAAPVPGSRKERYRYDLAPASQRDRQLAQPERAPQPAPKIKRRTPAPMVIRRRGDNTLNSNS